MVCRVPQTLFEIKGSEGTYFVLSDKNGLCPVVGYGVQPTYSWGSDLRQRVGYKGFGLVESKPLKPHVLVLDDPQPLVVSVVDAQGSPLADAIVGILAHRGMYQSTNAAGKAVFQLPKNSRYLEGVYAIKPGHGLDYTTDQVQWTKGISQESELPREVSLVLRGARQVKVVLKDEKGKLLKGIPVYPSRFTKKSATDTKSSQSISWYSNHGMGATDWSVTNERGEAVFDWLPPSQEISFRAHLNDLSHNQIKIGATGETVAEFVMTHAVEVSGRVLDVDGNPVVGVNVYARHGGSYSPGVSNEEGKYSLSLRPGGTFFLEAIEPKGGSESAAWQQRRRGVSDWVDTVVGQPVRNLDIVLKPTARVSGRVTYTGDSRPASYVAVTTSFNGPPGRDPIRLGEHSTQSRGYAITVFADSKGRFEFYAVPGEYDLNADPYFRSKREFIVEDTEEHKFNIEIPKEIPLKGRVVSGNPAMPVPNATIETKYLSDLPHQFGYDWVTNDAGEINYGHRDREPMVLWGHNEDKSQWGFKELEWDTPEFVMKLSPLVSLKVRILNSKRERLANQDIVYGIYRRMVVESEENEIQQTLLHRIDMHRGKTDADGLITLDNLIVGADYTVCTSLDDQRTKDDPEQSVPIAKWFVDKPSNDVVELILDHP